MQAYLKAILFIFLIVPLLTCIAYADFDIENELLQRDQITESLTEKEKQLVGDISDDGIFETEAALKRIVKDAVERIRGSVRAEYSKCISAFAISLCTALSAPLCGEQRFIAYINIIACAGVTVIILGTNDSFFSETMATLLRLSDYSKAALPVICTAAAAGGALTSASAKYAVCCLGLDVLITAAEKFIIPMINAYAALCVCSAFCDYAIIKSVARFTKWCAVTLMSAITLCFTVYLSLTGIITGTADAAAVKTVKTVISTALPVVGGMISDSSSAVLAAASLIRNTAGVFSLTAVCAICAYPMLSVLIRFLLIKLTGAISDFSSGVRVSQLMNDIGTVAGMLAGLTGACAIMVFISITSMLKAVT